MDASADVDAPMQESKQGTMIMETSFTIIGRADIEVSKYRRANKELHQTCASNAPHTTHTQTSNGSAASIYILGGEVFNSHYE